MIEDLTQLAEALKKAEQERQVARNAKTNQEIVARFNAMRNAIHKLGISLKIASIDATTSGRIDDTQYNGVVTIQGVELYAVVSKDSPISSSCRFFYKKHGTSEAVSVWGLADLVDAFAQELPIERFGPRDFVRAAIALLNEKVKATPCAPDGSNADDAELYYSAAKWFHDNEATIAEPPECDLAHCDDGDCPTPEGREAC